MIIIACEDQKSQLNRKMLTELEILIWSLNSFSRAIEYFAFHVLSVVTPLLVLSDLQQTALSHWYLSGEEHRTDYKITCVCHSVSLSVNTPMAAILIRLWWNFVQWFGAPKSKTLLGWKSDVSFRYFAPIFKNLHYVLWWLQGGITRPPWKITARCLYLPHIVGPGLSDDVVKIPPLPTPVAMATNFETKIDYNSAPWKIIARCFHLLLYFWALAIRWCNLNFLPADLCCHGNEFWDKNDYNSAPWKIIAPCLHLPLIFWLALSDGII